MALLQRLSESKLAASKCKSHLPRFLRRICGDLKGAVAWLFWRSSSGSSGSPLQPVLLHLGKRADGGQAPSDEAFRQGGLKALEVAACCHFRACACFSGACMHPQDGS